jgi:hypothetical protein
MDRRLFLAVALWVSPLGFAGCAAGGGGAGGGGDPDLLTAENLAPYMASDTYTVIRRLRGNWLRTRATGTMTDMRTGQANPNLGANDESQIKVYVDGSLRIEGVESLKSLPVEDVLEIRRLNARDATMQYGTDHGAGAILVTTKS